jgi:hypothetical protein
MRRASDLKVLHEGAASMEHAIRWWGGEWKPYRPTRFIYSFFTFNSLYSIDWNKSLERRMLISHDGDNTSEAERYHKYIDFCFQNSDFVERYGSFVYEYVTSEFSVAEILQEFTRINVDKTPNGGIYTQDFIDRFYDACVDCLERRNFNKRNCLMMVKFIYKIRCNIFHGTKTLKELYDINQQRRIEIYTAIIIAVNQMVFSYLAYLAAGDKFDGNFSFLHEQLRIEKYFSHED